MMIKVKFAAGYDVLQYTTDKHEKPTPMLPNIGWFQQIFLD